MQYTPPTILALLFVIYEFYIIIKSVDIINYLSNKAYIAPPYSYAILLSKTESII